MFTDYQKQLLAEAQVLIAGDGKKPPSTLEKLKAGIKIAGLDVPNFSIRKWSGETIAFSATLPLPKLIEANKYNLRDVELIDVDLRDLDLTAADFTGASLKRVTFKHTFLDRCSFRGAFIEDCFFQNVVLDGSDFTRASLVRNTFGPNINFSGVKGIRTAAELLSEWCEQDELGVIVYRVFSAVAGEKTFISAAPPPSHWNIRPGSFITESVMPGRYRFGGSGVAFTDLTFGEHLLELVPNRVLWKCRIRWMDLADTEVSWMTKDYDRGLAEHGLPYPLVAHMEGRCARLELLEVVGKSSTDADANKGVHQ
jgi:uncharacterized protein YjbI with pentapeptide repeats